MIIGQVHPRRNRYVFGQFITIIVLESPEPNYSLVR